jgi:hypothetical protein
MGSEREALKAAHSPDKALHATKWIARANLSLSGACVRAPWSECVVYVFIHWLITMQITGERSC